MYEFLDLNRLYGVRFGSELWERPVSIVWNGHYITGHFLWEQVIGGQNGAH